MDITSVFGTAVPGSNPGGGTKIKKRLQAVFLFLCLRESQLLGFRPDSKAGTCCDIGTTVRRGREYLVFLSLLPLVNSNRIGVKNT